MIGPIDNSLRSIMRHGLSLEAKCRKCSHTTIIDPHMVARQVDPRTSIHKLPLLCKICQTKGAIVSAYPPDWK